MGTVAQTVAVIAVLFGMASFAGPVAAEHVARDEVRWACGSGAKNAEGCGIDAIHDPEFTTRPWIERDDLVIGLVLGAEARAYPVRMLDEHEIVNDQIGGQRIAITWCPLCGSAIAFDRIAELGGERRVLSFEVSGYLYKHDLVMWDAGTGTMWTQIRGEPIGTLTGERVSMQHANGSLAVVSSELTTWRDWQGRHPGTKLLSNEGRDYGGAYAGYDADCRIGVYGDEDCSIGPLHPKEQVIGVAVGETVVAYPLFGVFKQGGLVIDGRPERTLVVVGGSGHAQQVFDAGALRFEKQDDHWVDQEGRAWDLPLGRGRDHLGTLPAVDHVTSFWFAWEAHHPGTALWLPEDLEGRKTGDGAGFLPGPGMLPIIVTLLIGLALARTRSACNR